MVYLKSPCSAADVQVEFFLHIVPEDLEDLPADRRQHGFGGANFHYGNTAAFASCRSPGSASGIRAGPSRRPSMAGGVPEGKDSNQDGIDTFAIKAAYKRHKERQAAEPVTRRSVGKRLQPRNYPRTRFVHLAVCGLQKA